MNHNLTNDQQRLIAMYITQYNQTNNHIDQLLDMLDEIRNNITNVLSSGQSRRNRLNRHSRNSNTNINRFINQLFNDRQNEFIRYDYNNPINPREQHYYTSYNSTNNSNNNSNNRRYQTSSTTSEQTDLSTFLTNFLNTTVTVRPTDAQIQNASRIIRYRDIERPLSESCPILLDRFQPEQMVRQIIHCGHIFCQQEFQQWFENNVQCPVCRYDIRTYRPASSNSETNNINNNNEIEETAFDMSNNEIPNNIVDNIASRLFHSILFPQNQTDEPFMLDPSNNLFLFDPSNNILFYEALLRPNSRNNTRR